VKRVILALFLTVALVLGLTSCINGSNVYVFGDSLVVNSTNALNSEAPGITVEAFGGTAVCHWNSQMKAVADKHPRVVIASFVGNSGGCAGVADTENYWLIQFLQVANVSDYYASKGVQLYWAGYPVGGQPSVYPYVNDWERVQSSYKWAANKYSKYVHWFDAGLTVAPNHCYTPTINGKTVRDPDKLHLTPYGAELYAKELVKPAI
jgi:hypothetical protein